MTKRFTKILGVIALTGWMGVANASLIFDFSYGTTGNELVGEITGLDDFIDGQLQSAESINFTTATGIYAAFRNIGVLSTYDILAVNENEFIIVNRQFTFVNFQYYDWTTDSLTGDSVWLEIYFRGDGGLEIFVDKVLSASAPRSDFNGFVNRVAPTPAPEPSAVFLLALGLAGVSFSRYKKKS
jgi:hypothetical protein